MYYILCFFFTLLFFSTIIQAETTGEEGLANSNSQLESSHQLNSKNSKNSKVEPSSSSNSKLEVSNLTISLPTISVVATKTAHNSFDLPFVTATIDMDALENVGASSLGDIFKNEAGISVTGTRKNGQDITLRGYDDRSINFVIDGVRQNFYAEHDGSIFVDPFLLKSVDVAYGSTSALYGNGGLGGTILFTTKNAKDLLNAGENFGARMSIGYDSVDSSLLSGVSAYGRTDTLDYVLSANYISSNDIKLGNGETLRADDNITSFLAKASYSLNNNNYLYFKAMGFYNNGQEPNAPEMQHSKVDDSDVDKKVHNTIFSVSHKYANNDNSYNVTTKAYVDFISIEETILSDDPNNNKPPDSDLNPNPDIFSYNDDKYDETGEVHTRNFITYGIDNEHINSFTTGKLKHTLLYGAEAYTDEQAGTNTLPDGSIYPMVGVPNANDYFVGTYLQDELMFDSKIGNFYLVPGIRYDYYQAVNTNDLQNSYDQLSPKIGLSYKPIEELIFFTNYAHGFRAPKITEVFATGQHFPSNDFITNAELKPESNDTFEIGMGLQQNYTNSNYRVRIAYFTTLAQDFIDLQITRKTTQYVNVANAEISGVSASADYTYNQLDITASYAYTTGTDTNTGDYLTNLTPQTVVTNIIYNFDTKKCNAIGYRITYAADFNQINSPEDYRSSYLLNDIYYQIMPFKSNLTLYLGIDNIFDVDYQVVSSYYEQVGRNFKMLLTYQW